METGWLCLCCVLAYFLGTVNPAYGFTRIQKGSDIRDTGSGNAGATNASRILGKSWGFIVLFLDMGKGMLAALLPSFWGHSSPFFTILVGGFAVLGHMFPVFLSFRGGKGIATILGVAIVVDQMVGFWMIVVGVTLIVITRYVSLSCLIMLLFFPGLLWLQQSYSTGVLVCSVAIILLSWARHHSNIANLLRGKERRFRWNS